MAALQLTADTSIVVPAILEDHPLHESAAAALGPIRWLPAHVLCECVSSLTRMPRPARVDPAAVWAALQALFPEPPRALSAQGYVSALHRLTASRLAGGRVYDAIVAATAVEAGATLVSADRRAASTYALIGADFQLIH